MDPDIFIFRVEKKSICVVCVLRAFSNVLFLLLGSFAVASRDSFLHFVLIIPSAAQPAAPSMPLTATFLGTNFLPQNAQRAAALPRCRARRGVKTWFNSRFFVAT